MKQEEKERSFDLALKTEQLKDKTAPKPSSPLDYGLIPVIDLSRYDAGYLMRLCRRGFVPVRFVAPLAGCN